MRKFYGFLVILLALAFVLIGCSSPTASIPATSAPATTVKPAPAASTVAPSPVSSYPAAASTKPNTSPSDSSATPKLGGTLNVIVDSVPPTSIGYPPDLIADATTAPQLCLEGLLHEDSKGNVFPWLASSYTIANDLKSVTFTLNKGIKFHDGSDFNAEVAKWNLDNQIKAKNRPEWTSIEIIDDYTIRVNLAQWRNYVMRTLGDGSGSWMISKLAYDKNGLDWVRQNPVGTGPFKLANFARDVGFKTTKNTNYWQAGKPYLDAINILFVSDQTTQKAVLQSGGADMIIMEPGKQAADLKALGLTVKADLVTTFNLVPDTANADSPLAKQEVREATEFALNKESYSKALSYGYWGAPYQVPGPATPPYDPDFKLARKYDLNKAKQLLTQAGYTSSNPATFSIICVPISLNKDLDQLIQADLTAAGMKVTLEFPEAAKWQSYNTQGWKNAYIFQPFAGNANWNNTLSSYFNPTSSNNKSWVRTPEFLDAFDKSVTSRAPEVTLIRAASDTFIKQATIIPVIEAGRGWAWKPYVMNAGWLERSLSTYWKPEQAWLNK
jgi:peptide/nickel transport system substrate-binding protein